MDIGREVFRIIGRLSGPFEPGQPVPVSGAENRLKEFGRLRQKNPLFFDIVVLRRRFSAVPGIDERRDRLVQGDVLLRQIIIILIVLKEMAECSLPERDLNLNKTAFRGNGPDYGSFCRSSFFPAE